MTDLKIIKIPCNCKFVKVRVLESTHTGGKLINSGQIYELLERDAKELLLFKKVELLEDIKEEKREE